MSDAAPADTVTAEVATKSHVSSASACPHRRDRNGGVAL